MAATNVPNRHLALIGGRLETDNTAVFEELRRLADGRIAIIPTASEIPEEVGEDAVTAFRAHGFDTTLIELYGRDRFRNAHETRIQSTLESYRSVFFTGGDQLRIVETLVQDNRPTPVLETIRRLLASGALIAGSSAGAAVMSERMILSGTSAEALIDGVVTHRDAPGLAFGYGLGFFPWGVVDQHFIKRGRMGRLVVAVRAASDRYGFGVDENTAFFVDGSRGRVCGETGMVVVDLGDASFDDNGDITGVRFSYLDDGDAYDLRAFRPLPRRDKKSIRIGKHAYARPAPLTRNAFGSYTLHDLMIRLAKGDPARYSQDSASARRREGPGEIRMTLERAAGVSRALTANREGESRYTTIDFLLHFQRGRDAAVLTDDRPSGIVSTAPAEHARLVLLGNSPLRWTRESVAALRPYLTPPVGVIAAASAYTRSTAERYLRWLEDLGLPAIDLEVRPGNIERLGRSRRALAEIRGVGSYLLVGGDQQRLAETLVLRGEVTTVFEAMLDAYAGGTPMIACGGAAAAFGRRMIVAGDSFEALRYGASEDAGYEGMVIEEGFGLFTPGIVDQNFLERRRLGRLLVACVEENIDLGIGLSEQSGLLVEGGGQALQAFGRNGVLVARTGAADARCSADRFSVRDIQLHWLAAGERFVPGDGTVSSRAPDREADDRITRLVHELAATCDGALVESMPGDDAPWLSLKLSRGDPLRLHIESQRVLAVQA